MARYLFPTLNCVVWGAFTYALFGSFWWTWLAGGLAFFLSTLAVDLIAKGRD